MCCCIIRYLKRWKIRLYGAEDGRKLEEIDDWNVGTEERFILELIDDNNEGTSDDFKVGVEDGSIIVLMYGFIERFFEGCNDETLDGLSVGTKDG